MKCFNHPTSDAVGVCAQCGRFGCTNCLADISNTLLCTSCRQAVNQEIAMTHAEMVAGARRMLRFSWVFTAVLAIFLVPAAFAQAGAGGILLAPLLVYFAWSFFWGIGPVWRGFSNVLAGWGCFGTWMFLLIVAVVLCELIVVGAIAYGALGGGISRYRQAKQLVESAA